MYRDQFWVNYSFKINMYLHFILALVWIAMDTLYLERVCWEPPFLHVHVYSKSCNYIALWLWGKAKHSDWFLLGQDFTMWTISMDTVISHVFCSWKRVNSAQRRLVRVPFNKLLDTNFVSLSGAGQYCPLIEMYAPCYAWSILLWPWTNIPQCGPCPSSVRSKN